MICGTPSFDLGFDFNVKCEVKGHAQLTFCMGWTCAELELTWACHTRAHDGWAEGGQAQVHPKYLGLPTFLLGRARLGLPKQLIGLATAGACPST